MIELHILAGKKAGSQSAVRRFPFRIGRDRGNDLQLSDDGTWGQHLTLEFRRREGFTLAASPDALVMINHQPVQTALLRNGDVISFGSVKLRFWLAAAQQRGLRLREGFVWALLMAVVFCQFVLIYRLIR
jgi:pSer/pThr/pTyr-binding forkhead associated (FHA) protein